MHIFNSTIFREYDIRGIHNETLHKADAYQIGLNYGSLIKSGEVAVGYDGRLSSPELSNSLIEGINDAGVDVINLGLVPTPLTYFSVFHLDLSGAIMVTGSHNPPTHNGFKIMFGKESLFGDEIRALEGVRGQVSGVRGKVEKKDLREVYVNRIIRSLSAEPCQLDIGWDPGNGAAGEIAAMLSKKLGGQQMLINQEIDGNFPSHHPDPSEEKNLQQLIALVKNNKLDVGFAFDGDGDRVGVIDNLGRPIWGDQILAILSKEIGKKYPGAPIIADVKTSQAVFDYIAAQGAKPVMWKTGHSLVKAKMKELNAPLAGEMSAHIFFADDYYGFDDGVYAAVRFLDVMIKSGKTSSELLDELPKTFSTPEMRIACTEERKFQIVAEVKAAVKADGLDFSDIDGVRVKTEMGWWLLRASNTGSLLVARCEAVSQAELDNLVNVLKNYLVKSGISF